VGASIVVFIIKKNQPSTEHDCVYSVAITDIITIFIFLPLVGASRGVLIAWRTQLGALAASRIDSFSATVQFSPKNGDAWWLTVVYGLQGNDNKIAFLQEL
jgi:hypothetical protein